MLSETKKDEQKRESPPRLLLFQISNDTVCSSWEIINKDFREVRVKLIEKYPQMVEFLEERFFNFDKIWPNWVDILSWKDDKNNMSLEYIKANIQAETTVMSGTCTIERLRIELQEAKDDGHPYTHVGFGIYPIGYLQFIECAQTVKEFDANIITLAGNIGCLIEDTINHVDHVVWGNGIPSLRKILGEEPDAPYTVNLSHSPKKGYKRSHLVNLVTKLGCPMKCDFCMTSKFFDAKITKPLVTPKQVYDAIDKVNKSTQRKVAVTMCEPNLLLFHQWWYELFELFEDYTDPVSVSGPAMISSVKKFDFKRILDSSLHFGFFNLGIESFTKKYDKNVGFEEMKQIINQLREIGIGTLASFIIGFDFHTRENLMKEIKMLTELDCLHYLVQNLKAFPQTPTYESLKQEGKIIELPYDFYYIDNFQAFKHPEFKMGFEDILPLTREIYTYIYQETGHEVLNSIKIYENKQKKFKHFADSAQECRMLSKQLFPSWKKYLHPTEKQIEKYLQKLE